MLKRPSVSHSGSEKRYYVSDIDVILCYVSDIDVILCYVSDIDVILCNVSDINECDPSPCQNGGTCSTPNVNMYQCDCTGTGYTGTNCETGKFQKCYKASKRVFSEKNNMWQ